MPNFEEPPKPPSGDDDKVIDFGRKKLEMKETGKLDEVRERADQERSEDEAGPENLKDYFGQKFLELIAQESKEQRERIKSSVVIRPGDISESEFNINVLLQTLQRLDEIPNMPQDVAQTIKGMSRAIDMQKSTFEEAKEKQDIEKGRMHQMWGKGSIDGLLTQLEKIFPQDLVDKFRM